MVAEFFNRFDEFSHSEWFDSAEEIENYFADGTNFQRLIDQEFDKLNILFSVILLKEYKSAFDTVIKESIASFSRVPKEVLESMSAFVWARFPSINLTLNVRNRLILPTRRDHRIFALIAYLYLTSSKYNDS